MGYEKEMTDGIIQETIDGWLESRAGIEDLKRKLIEKITSNIREIAFKANCDGYAPVASYQKACSEIRQKLIGDNQEESICKHDWQGIDNPFGSLYECLKCKIRLVNGIIDTKQYGDNQE